jgi:phosphoglucosamine mutase
MSNLGLERALDRIEVGLVRAPVGDRYVVEAMRNGKFNLGGEPSGHIVLLDHNTTGDGLITALQALAIMRNTGRCLSELTADFERFPQVLVNVQVAEKKPIESLTRVTDVLAKVEDELAGRGRVLIRYSGTEPLARVMIEGEDERRVSELAHDIASELKRELGGT